MRDDLEQWYNGIKDDSALLNVVEYLVQETNTPATTQQTQNYTVEITIGDYDPNWDTPNQVPCAPQTCYSLDEITINVGDSVTWVNTDPNKWYTLMGDWGGLEPWYSGNYVGTSGFSGGHVAGCDGPGHLGYDMCGTSGYDITSWTHTFDQVGTYKYHDWAFMNYPQRPEGVVNVVSSGAPPPSSQMPVITTQTGDTTPPVIHIPTPIYFGPILDLSLIHI